MDNFIRTAVKYFVLLNVALYLASLLVGSDFEFNFITNLLVPVLCAYAELEVRHLKEKRFAKQ